MSCPDLVDIYDLISLIEGQKMIGGPNAVLEQFTQERKQLDPAPLTDASSSESSLQLLR